MRPRAQDLRGAGAGQTCGSGFGDEGAGVIDLASGLRKPLVESAEPAWKEARMNLGALSLGERIRLIARLAAAEHVRQEIEDLRNQPPTPIAPKAKLRKVARRETPVRREAA